MDGLYKELVFPSLVKDVQRIFWKHILPFGRFNRNQTLKNIKIDTSISEHQPMTELMIKYPFLSNQLLVFVLPAGVATPIHMDGLGNESTNRKISCNIPVEGCDHCVTEFFNADIKDFRADVPGVTRYLKSDSVAVKIGEYRLLENVILTNTQSPHRVDNTNGIVTRYSVSWTIEDSIWSIEAIEKLSIQHSKGKI